MGHKGSETPLTDLNDAGQRRVTKPDRQGRAHVRVATDFAPVMARTAESAEAPIVTGPPLDGSVGDESQLKGRPLLRWAGSKRGSLHILRALVPAHYRRYIEPFAGSACLFAELHPPIARLGDVNCALIGTYRELRRAPLAVFASVMAYEQSGLSYTDIRRIEAKSLPPVDRAGRFIYLNRHAFNGIYRVNRRGVFNVPQGRRTGAIPTRNDFVTFGRCLQNVELIAGDFEYCLRDAGPDDFCYLDPPFPSGRSAYGEYGYDGQFRRVDVPRLAAALERLDSVGATFILSYGEERLVMGNMPWRTIILDVRQQVAANPLKRTMRREVLITNLRDGGMPR